MKRGEFFHNAVIQLAAALATQSGAWKAQMDKAEEMAGYLTTKVYGEYKPCEDTSGCKPLDELTERIEEYYMAVIDLQLLYELLMLQGHHESSEFMRGIKAAHDHIRDKQK
jgi:hypothetical protein